MSTDPSARHTDAGRAAISTLSPQLADDILDLYDDDLAYHHSGHALEVAARAVRLAGCALDAGHRPDVEVVRLAALLHDAGYRDAPVAASREAYAAQLATRVLDSHGYLPRTVAAVADAVLATEYEAAPATLEGHLVRAADLAPMAAPFEVFAANTELLRVEAELLSGAPVPDVVWFGGVAEVIGGFVRQPRWDPATSTVNANSTWHALTLDNLATYLRTALDQHRPR